MMKLSIERSDDRGTTQLEWLDSKHSFSFGRYENPDRMRFGSLIVFNEDVIAPRKGFGAHPHENAEVVTIVLQGALRHEDSLGNNGLIRAGEIQRMTAGWGITHSEMNASAEDVGHFIQLWIEPSKNDLKPSYEQKAFSWKEADNKLVHVASSNGEGMHINQNAQILMGSFSKGKTTSQTIAKESGLFVFVIRGLVQIGNAKLSHGDSAQITDTDMVTIEALEESRVLVIEVPL